VGTDEGFAALSSIVTPANANTTLAVKHLMGVAQNCRATAREEHPALLSTPTISPENGLTVARQSTFPGDTQDWKTVPMVVSFRLCYRPGALLRYSAVETSFA